MPRRGWRESETGAFSGQEIERDDREDGYSNHNPKPQYNVRERFGARHVIDECLRKHEHEAGEKGDGS